MNKVKLEACYNYNAGVMVYKSNNNVMNFFYRWYDIFKSTDEYTMSQPALTHAIALTDNLKYYVCPLHYNFHFPFFNTLHFDSKVKILHGRAKDFTKISKVVNKTDNHRIWSPITRKCIKYNSEKVIFAPKGIYKPPIKRYLQKLKQIVLLQLKQ